MKKNIFRIVVSISLFVLSAKCAEDKNDKTSNIKKNEIKLKITNPEISAQPLIKTTLTMDEAVEIAYQNKPDLKAYKYAIEEYKMKAKEALAGYFPNITLNVDYTQVQKQQTPALNAQLDVNQLVFSFAGPIEYYKQARKATQVVEYANEKDKKIIRNEVEKAFLECWQVQQQQKSIQALYNASTENFARAEHANKVELLDKSTWLKSTSDHALNLATVDNYYEFVEIARQKLEFFMGQPLDLEIEDVRHPKNKISSDKNYKLKVKLIKNEGSEKDDDVTVLSPLGSYFDYAIKNREELKIALKNSEIAKDSVKIARGSRMPTVNLYMNTGTSKVLQADPDVYIGRRNSFYTVSAQVSWPVFDGLVSYYKENEAHATMLKELLNKDQAAQQAKFDVERTYHTLLSSHTTFKAKNLELKYAKNELKLKNQQFKIGEISKVELEIAKSDYEKYFYSWLEAKTDTEIKKRDLLFACGYPKEIN